MDKLEFLVDEFVAILSAMDGDSQPLFGKMNFQQMVEHMSFAFRQASGLVPFTYEQDERITAKAFTFMMSEKPFKDNTPNSLLPEEPLPLIHNNLEEGLKTLQADILVFVKTYEGQAEKRIKNPFFGELNFEENVHLLHKHALHHLRQFGFE